VLQVVIRISDIKLDLTQVQYRHLIEILESIPRVMALPSKTEEQETFTLPQAERTASDSSNEPQDRGLVDLDPELRNTPSSARWTAIDLVLTIDTVKLHLYDSSATAASNLKDHGIVRFALNYCELRLKVLSDGASEAQIVFKSLTMSNTRPTQSQFREIIPAAHHGRNQFMLLYTSGGKTGIAILTVDFPQIIFTIDPVIALLDFFANTFSVDQVENSTADIEAQQNLAETQPTTKVDFRIDVHNVAISVLEDDADPESQAIMLAVQQVSLSQQVGLNV
jgi:vacuolar protein sorting-associated protein 13A/C